MGRYLFLATWTHVELSGNGFSIVHGPLIDVFFFGKSERLGKLDYFLLANRSELGGQSSNHPETFSRPDR